ncbi:high-affinity Fe2+/Pb2+ permease [Glutamicibacter halophytocola]|uniref:iron uptake transporter permease EfeU n=1 Tax=Glutamicibacter halophytocola TaxID=1933880 RepID=UPI0006D4B867|nr:iron uptake transporter permease EfeU [Glutamicibacter halophytocola]ALG30813.1 high-affinity Fe2+/Pb2+ permease [Glutamicibacter halophytocola]
MLGNFLIGLREGLEAVLIVVLLIAYLTKTDRRNLLPRIWAGVAFAVIVSLGFGALLTFGPRGLTFQAQEIIGGGLSIIAAGLVTWMIFWMAGASKTLNQDLKNQVDKAATGSAWGLVMVGALSVGREGLETTLFIWAAARSTGETWQPLLGAVLGLIGAIAIGLLLHRGIVKIQLSKFFTWTGALLVVVAAGVFSYGVHDLQEAAVLPGIHALAYDFSAAIPPSGWLGTVLQGVFNFIPATPWLAAIAWWAYLVPVMFFYLRKTASPPRAAKTRAAAAS